MKRMLLLSCLLGATALAATPSDAAPRPKKPRGGDRPPAPRRPKVKRTTPELTLVRVQRTDRGPVFPGNTITVHALVQNQSDTTARVGVLLTPTHPAAQPVRMPAFTIPPRRSHWLSMRVKVDRYAVKNESFTGTFMLYDPASRARSYLAQRWKDANQGDNSKQLTLPVNVPNYSITAKIKALSVSHDCKTSQWEAATRLGSLPSGYRPRNGSDYPRLHSGFRVGADVSWPLHSVDSGKTTPVNITMKIPRLGKDRHLTLFWGPSFDYYDPGENDDKTLDVGTIIEVLEPARWKRGGTFTFSRVLSPARRCGPRPYTLQVQIQAFPANEVLH